MEDVLTLQITGSKELEVWRATIAPLELVSNLVVDLDTNFDG